MATRTCRVHGELPEDQFRRRKDRNETVCRLCQRDRKARNHDPAKKSVYNKAYYAANRSSILASSRDYQLRTKVEVLTRYAGNSEPKCRHCDETDIRFLCLDHVNGGGKAHKTEIGGAGGYVYLWARKHGYPDLFQVLCHNCNFRKWKPVSSCPRRFQIRSEVLTHYGNGKLACVECGESDLAVLTLDHANNDGAEHRRKLEKQSLNLYRFLKKEGYPIGFQTLCQNHNLGKHCLG